MNDLLDRIDHRTHMMLAVSVLTVVAALLIFLSVAINKDKVIAETGGYSTQHILEAKWFISRTNGFTTIRNTITGVFLIGLVVNLFIFIKGKIDGKRNLNDSEVGKRGCL